MILKIGVPIVNEKEFWKFFGLIYVVNYEIFRVSGHPIVIHPI